MMIQEFTALTKYEPTYEEYVKEIEPIYYEFDGNKQEFCKAWAKLYKHKIKNQQFEKNIPEMLQMVRNTDFGYAVNKKVWAYAGIGLKLLTNIDKGYIELAEYEKGLAYSIGYNTGMDGDSWFACITYDLHAVEFDENGARCAIKYIAHHPEILEAYEYAKKVAKKKAA